MTASARSRANAFAALELDRQGDRRDDAAWLASHRTDGTARYLLLRDDGRALTDASGAALRLLDAVEAHALFGEPHGSFLGLAGAAAHYAVRADETLAERVAGELGAGFLDLRSAGLRLPAFEAGLFAYARALGYWQQRTRFCSACGAPIELLAAGHRARCISPDCAQDHFPRTDPAVIVIVSWRDACLLGRQPHWPEGRYSTLAGFVEPGETLEDAVRREVFEEAGVTVAECDYHSSQPWPFPASLMLGFTARAADPAIRVGSELSDARWFTPDELADGLRSRRLVLPPPLSVSFRLIEHWLAETAGLELAPLLNDEPWLRR